MYVHVYISNCQKKKGLNVKGKTSRKMSEVPNRAGVSLHTHLLQEPSFPLHCNKSPSGETSDSLGGYKER